MITVLNQLENKHKASLFRLWNNEYPAKLAYVEMQQFEDYLAQLHNISHYLWFDNFENIQAWAFTFTREKARWFAILLDKNLQNKGIGTQLLNFLKTKENQLTGWVIDHSNDIKLDGTIYKSPLQFYIKNKFEIIENQRLETDKISAVKIKWKNKNQ